MKYIKPYSVNESKTLSDIKGTDIYNELIKNENPVIVCIEDNNSYIKGDVLRLSNYMAKFSEFSEEKMANIRAIPVYKKNDKLVDGWISIPTIFKYFKVRSSII